MKPLILIPARMASTRLPKKPMANIAGVPMIVHCYRRAVEADLARVVVACDSDEIKQAIEAEGGQAVLTDANLPSGSDRIWQALQRLNDADAHDIIINLQGDMPTLDPKIIGDVLDPLKQNGFDMATLVAEIHSNEERENPAVVKAVLGGVAPNYRALYFSRQLVPANEGPHYHHIGIYAYQRKTLEQFINLPPSRLEMREKLEQLRALEAGISIGIRVVETVPLGVDTAEQLQQAREILS